MSRIFSVASKITKLPFVKTLSPGANKAPSKKELKGFLEALEGGVTEKHVAAQLNATLKKEGVESFFHKAFVWWGDRSRFTGVKHTPDFLPSNRKLKNGDIYILDVAPILKGYQCDIGYSNVFGQNARYEPAMTYLEDLRGRIPEMFVTCRSGGEVWRAVDSDIKKAGYDNIHNLYPFSVLGHRIHFQKNEQPGVGFLNFGWQSYWSLISRGLFGQLLNQNFAGDLTGLWAIEPHIGGNGFGVKFEEILLVDENGARWIEKDLFR